MNRARQRGLGLLEALLAVGILAAGMLTLLAAVNRSHSNARDAHASHQAAGLLMDLAQRLHTHQAMFRSQTAALYAARSGQAVALEGSCQAQACSDAQWARLDLAEWAASVSEQMPQAQWAISDDGAPEVSVWLSWHSPGGLPLPQTSATTPANECPAQAMCVWAKIYP